MVTFLLVTTFLSILRFSGLGMKWSLEEASIMTCPLCWTPFVSHSLLLSHLLNVHNKVSCTHCGEVFNSRQSLSYHHDKKHRQREELKCTICGKAFTRMWSKKKHMETIHQAFAATTR